MKIRNLISCLAALIICCMLFSCTEKKTECDSVSIKLDIENGSATPERVQELSEYTARVIAGPLETYIELINAADEVMKDKFGISDLSCFDVYYHGGGPSSRYVEYKLYLYGYKTPESYRVYYNEDREVVPEESVAIGVKGKSIYEAMQTLSASRFADAEATIKKASGTGCYVTVANGKLYLSAEVIIGEEGEKTHKHVHYSIELDELS